MDPVASITDPYHSANAEDGPVPFPSYWISWIYQKEFLTLEKKTNSPPPSPNDHPYRYTLYCNVENEKTKVVCRHSWPVDIAEDKKGGKAFKLRFHTSKVTSHLSDRHGIKDPQKRTFGDVFSFSSVILSEICQACTVRARPANLHRLPRNLVSHTYEPASAYFWTVLGHY